MTPTDFARSLTPLTPTTHSKPINMPHLKNETEEVVLLGLLEENFFFTRDMIVASCLTLTFKLCCCITLCLKSNF